tara:strand:- start:15388 stop:16248 length:861 start_codon:yes stop_codon:yes gene_type:complete
MSNQITTAFSQQFGSTVALLSQQRGSVFRNAVRNESVTGEKAFFDQVSSVSAVKRTTRHSDTPLVEVPHSRRQVVMETYEFADLIDDADMVSTIVDPTSAYAQSAAAAMNRAVDDEIIAAATGTSKTGKAGSTSTDLAAAHIIAHGSAGLTVAKLLAAKEQLDLADVDPSIPRHIAVAPQQIKDLLNTTEVKSSDFNTVKALAQGELNSYLGFTFHMSNRLALSSTTRTCFAWAQDGILLAIGQDQKSRIEERSDKSFSTQVYYSQTVGATRMEEDKVVSVLCTES